MGWLNFLNKAFPEPKPRKKKKLKNWEPDPKYFENNLNKQQEKKKQIKTKLEVAKLLRKKYTGFSGPKNEKLEWEKQVDRQIDFAKSRMLNVKPPINYLEETISGSIKRNFYVKQEQNLTKEQSEKIELSIERLIRMRYISRDPDVREKQIQSLGPWIKYIRRMMQHEQIEFDYFVLRSILKYDLYWLDKNEDGSWKTGERRKTTEKEFPVFDPDLTPEILGKMKEVLAVLDLKIPKAPSLESAERPLDFQGRTPIYVAIKNADFRELYYLIKEEIEKSRITENDIENQEEGKWLPVFSYRDCKNDEEKKKVAVAVTKATEYSRGFCIKSPQTADEYLRDGDLYIYNMPSEVKNKDGTTKKVNISEVAIHVLDGVEINPGEVHGSAKDQGIKKEYLGIAKKFIMEGDFINKEMMELKFADAELFEEVKEKIKDKQELSARELIFLFELYRYVYLFDINDGDNEMNGLRMRFAKNKGKNLDEAKKEALSKIFNIEEKDIFLEGYFYHDKLTDFIKDNIKIFDGDLGMQTKKENHKEIVVHTIPKNLKIVVGDVSIYGVTDLGNLEEITGSLLGLSHDKIHDFGKLKKIKGILITEEDKKAILNKEYSQFPETYDRRLEKLFY